MKILFLTAVISMHLATRWAAVLLDLPEIPVPTLAVTNVLAIAQQHVPSGFSNCTLVAVEWCKASEFQPRYSDGTHFSSDTDDPNEYCWFLTYVYTNKRLPKGDGGKRRFNSVFVLRVKDNGTIRPLAGFRP